MHHIRRLVLVLAALTIAVFAGLAVSSVTVRTEEPPQNRLDAVLAAKLLRVGTTGDYRPFSFQNDATKSFEGVDIDMARALAKALGVEVEFVQTSWPHLIAPMKSLCSSPEFGRISKSLIARRNGSPRMVDASTLP